MKAYTTTFKIAASIISLPCGFLLTINIINFNIIGISIFVGILSLLWGCFWALRKEIAFAFHLSYLLTVIFWLPLGFRTIERISFILTNGGMEKSDGYGSPLAFLLGLTMEQFFFIPLTILVLVGTKQWLSLRKVGHL